jgi:hypothetical protein
MFPVTGPVTSSTSAWRGVATKRSRKRSRSWKALVQRVDLELAAVARAGVDLADRERAPEATMRRTVDWR